MEHSEDMEQHASDLTPTTKETTMKMEMLYQCGSTQVFRFRGTYALYTITSDGRARYMETPAKSLSEAIDLANNWETK
jgi:hypothetical protein